MFIWDSPQARVATICYGLIFLLVIAITIVVAVKLRKLQKANPPSEKISKAQKAWNIIAIIISYTIGLFAILLKIYDVHCTVFGARDDNMCNAWAWVKAVFVILAVIVLIIVLIGVLAGTVFVTKAISSSVVKEDAVHPQYVYVRQEK